MRQAEKDKMKFYSRISFKLDTRKKIPKKIAKKFKKLKTPFWHYLYPKRDEIGRDREKKNFSFEFHSCPSQARNSPKKKGKKFKQLKNIIQALFLYKPG